MDPSIFDPQGFDLGIVLTAAGVPVAAAVIAALIQTLKRVPLLGDWLAANNNARFANLLLCAVLIAYAAAAINVQLTLVSGFLLLLAWLNLAGFTDKAYAIAPDTLKATLAGG